MRVLVTGATGRIGSRFVPRLLEEGEPVRVLARDRGRAQRLESLGAEIALGDLRDREDVERALADVDAVVHLAAAFRSVPDEESFAVNQEATVELARSALRAEVSRFVYVSTNLVYGAGRGRPAREADETLPPPRAYPQGKAAAERALLELHRADRLPLRIVRLAFVYGDGDPHLAESLHWARNWPLHKRLHLIHHTDVAQALLRATRTDGIDGEIFNAADDAPITSLELFELNSEPIPDDAATSTLDDPWEGIVDTSAIRRQLGFRPIFPTLYTARDANAL